MLLDDLKKKPPGFGSVPQAPSAGMQPIGTPTGFGQVTRASVSDIAADMMNSDSPLMRQAETRGTQAANRRGLLNSSIAVGEAQRAQLDAVVPMAQAEADLRDREVGRKAEMNERQLDRDFRGGQAELDRTFQGGQSELDRTFRGTQAERDRTVNAQQAELDRANRMQLAQFDAGTRERLQKMEIDARKVLADMDIDANNRRGAEGMISSLLSLRQNTIANINNNRELSAEERASMIKAAEQNLRMEMAMVPDLFGVDVGEFLAQLPARPPAQAAQAAPTQAAQAAQAPRNGRERLKQEQSQPDPWR